MFGVEQAVAVSKSRSVRVTFRVLGFLALGVAIAGIALPLVPTTGPALAAGYFFSRSSARFEGWLLNNRWFGPILRDWRAGRGFTRRLKATGAVAVLATFSLTVGFAVSLAWLRIGLMALAIAIAVYILSLPTKPPDTPSSTG
jgi:uncharacterized membrane protein YbaN (DUF454 family)